jgi:ammonia channel protein AmtB
VLVKTLVKLIAWLFVIVLAAVVIIPLVVLAGLFIWLKLTEEADEEALELEQEMETGGESTPA